MRATSQEARRSGEHPDHGRGFTLVHQPAEQLNTVDPLATQTTVRFGCLLPAVRSPHEALVGDLPRRIIAADIEHLRPDLNGVDGVIDSDFFDFRGGANKLEGNFKVAPDALPRVFAGLHVWLDGTSQSTVPVASLERARWDIARRSPLRNSSNAKLARLIFNDWNMGWPVNARDDFAGDLASVDLAQVSAALLACRATSVISVVAP